MLDNYQFPFFTYNNTYIHVYCYRFTNASGIIELTFPQPGLVIDFALQNHFFLESGKLLQGNFMISQPAVPTRKIIPEKNTTAIFFSICITALPNGYDLLSLKKRDGQTTPDMMRQIFEMMNTDKQALAKARWIDTKILLLIKAILSSIGIKSTDLISFAETETICRIIDGLSKDQELVLTPDQVVAKSGIKKYRFQKGCRQLYGLSLREILYERLMTNAFKLLMEENRPAEEISRLLHYRSHENFITGFRNYFDSTPAVLQKSSPRY